MKEIIQDDLQFEEETVGRIITFVFMIDEEYVANMALTIKLEEENNLVPLRGISIRKLEEMKGEIQNIMNKERLLIFELFTAITDEELGDDDPLIIQLF